VASDISYGKIDQSRPGEAMGKFKISVARIEMISPNERAEDIRLTFQFESDLTSFALPIFLNSRDFDDTEIVKVARSKLYDVFWQLCGQCEDWQLSDAERRELAKINVRPARQGRRVRESKS
jgi:hypothetical protein